MQPDDILQKEHSPRHRSKPSHDRSLLSLSSTGSWARHPDLCVCFCNNSGCFFSTVFHCMNMPQITHFFVREAYVISSLGLLLIILLGKFLGIFFLYT